MQESEKDIITPALTVSVFPVMPWLSLKVLNSWHVMLIEIGLKATALTQRQLLIWKNRPEEGGETASIKYDS